MKYSVLIPVKIESLANKMEHWSKRHKRNKTLKFLIQRELAVNNVPIFDQVKQTQEERVKAALTRIAPRSLDSVDNLPSAMKPVIDSICDFFLPGLKAGRADSDKRFEFTLHQEKGKPKEYGLRIEIEMIKDQSVCF
jgi:hypothetical protein